MEVPGFLYLTAYLLWKILVAIVFALFLYVVFMSGIVTGSLFPQFRVTSEECREYIDMMKFMSKCLPNSNEDVAKMLTWAFVAGYAEKFVPNLINKISSKAEGNDD